MSEERNAWRTRRLDLYADAVRMDLMSVTAARVEMGTASLREQLGYRWPWLFRGFAEMNERRDKQHREFMEHMDALLKELGPS